MSVTADIVIGDLVAQHPQVIDLLQSYGLQCVGCHASVHETLEQGMLSHGKTPEEVTELVAAINSFLTAQADGPLLQLTVNAVTFVKQALASEGKEGWGLAVSVAPGGCSGFSYVLDFKEQADAFDEVLEQDGVKLFVDKDSIAYLKGLELDYVSSLQQSGFKFSNPNATQSCGCGKSVGF